jgi:RNA polymerase sigma-70 factor (ECF subfamily)
MNLHVFENSAARAPSWLSTAPIDSVDVNSVDAAVSTGIGSAYQVPAPTQEAAERSLRVIHEGEAGGRADAVEQTPPLEPWCAVADRGCRCERAESQARGVGARLGGDGELGEVFSGRCLGQGGAGEDSDEQLVLRIQFGDEEALALLRARYSGLLQSQACRLLRSQDEADDVVSEVFIEVWQRASGYHQEWARAVAWLVTLVRRRAIDRLRVRQRQRKVEVGLSQKQLLCTPDGGSPVEEEMRLGEIRTVLESALNRLPEEQGRAVWMAYYKGFSQKEISKITKAPVGTVKTRLEIGLRKMRQRLSREESILNALRGAGTRRSGARADPMPEGCSVAGGCEGGCNV